MMENTTPQNPDEMTRAQRLQAQSRQAQPRQAQPRETTHVQNADETLSRDGNAPRKAPRPGVRARDMNRRIRDLVREQENAFYAAPQSEVVNRETSPASPPRDTSSTRSPSSSSWEEIADEVASQNNALPRRGLATSRLATGAMRGASVGSARTETASPVWLPKPITPRAILCAPCAPDENLHEVLGGEVRNCDDYGTHYLVSKPAHQYDAHFSDLRERLERVLESEKMPILSGARVEDLLFVDIETTGLSSGQPLFLIGALSVAESAQLDLFLARDMDEEAAALSAFAQLAHGKTLVTFNGKSFDWPYIEGRSRAHRVRSATVKNHLDMLHQARRHWKHSLPNCKLQTLELYLCGRTRIDDVSGGEIPRTYHEFARRHAHDGTGAHLMSPILHHNALDILTTAELLCILGEK